MKKLLLLTIILALLLFGWQDSKSRHAALFALSKLEHFVTSFGSNSNKGNSTSSNTIFSIHRGRSSAQALDNSEASLRQTARGFRRIEVDLEFSADLIPYLSHGDDLSRQLGRPTAALHTFTSQELDQLTLLDGSRLLRFENFLANLSQQFDHIYLDVKTSSTNVQKKARVIAALLPQNAKKHFAVLGLSCPFITELKRERPDIDVGCESYLPLASWLAGFDIFSVNYQTLNSQRNEMAVLLNLKRLYWTAGTSTALEEILRWKPEGVLVDAYGEEAPTVPARWKKELQHEEIPIG